MEQNHSSWPTPAIRKRASPLLQSEEQQPGHTPPTHTGMHSDRLGLGSGLLHSNRNLVECQNPLLNKTACTSLWINQRQVDLSHLRHSIISEAPVPLVIASEAPPQLESNYSNRKYIRSENRSAEFRSSLYQPNHPWDSVPSYVKEKGIIMPDAWSISLWGWSSKNMCKNPGYTERRQHFHHCPPPLPP